MGAGCSTSSPAAVAETPPLVLVADAFPTDEQRDADGDGVALTRVKGPGSPTSSELRELSLAAAAENDTPNSLRLTAVTTSSAVTANEAAASKPSLSDAADEATSRPPSSPPPPPPRQSSESPSPPPHPAHLASPDIPFRWKRGELIGAGAFGRVYVGMRYDTGELIAAKQILFPPRTSHRPNEAEEMAGVLEREVALISNLVHPNVVQYLGTERTAEALHIFLEYVPGGSIASLLAKFGPFADPVISIYVKQVFCGLGFLHDNRVIHRDIKGANLLVDMNGVVKLADFGASKKVSETLSTVQKSIRGTPYWMAPEVIKQTGHGWQADIWSVACTIVEMATGKPPWSEFNTHVSVLFHIASSTEPPTLPEHMGADAKDLLLKCFQRTPTERPSCKECLAHPFVVGAVTPNGNGATGGRTTAMPHQESRRLSDRVVPPPALRVTNNNSLTNVKSAAAAARAAMSPKPKAKASSGEGAEQPFAPVHRRTSSSSSSSPPPPAPPTELDDSFRFDSIGSNMFKLEPSLWREPSGQLGSESSFARADDADTLASLTIDELRPPRRLAKLPLAHAGDVLARAPPPAALNDGSFRHGTSLLAPR
ncbi:protein kinase domain-containing protein [Pycnococcus provasolii]